MRIAIINHINQADSMIVSYLIGLLAEKWREDGHDVDFVVQPKRPFSADLVLLHVDLSVVPNKYIKIAQRFPIVLNGSVLDIRKSTVSKNLLTADSDYEGPVIVKTDLNAGGNPEHFYECFPFKERRPLRRWWNAVCRAVSGVSAPQPPGKDYRLFNNIKQVPIDLARNSRYVIEKFLPEVRDGLYYIRRCHILGDRSITQRMGTPSPIGGGFAPFFEWIETNRQVLEVARGFGLDYGAIDYTEVDGCVNIFDINKTIGLGALEHEVVRENNAKVVARLAPGIYSYVEANG
jgi:hypothetical protein